jgi:diamine N-acetyltransferase
MVDAGKQQSGYGSEAVRQLIEQLEQNPSVKQLYVSYSADNVPVRRLAAKLGFSENGDEEDSKQVAQLQLPAKHYTAPNVSLRDVTLENARECIRLKVAPGQERFVAANAASLVQSKFETYWLTKAVYNDEEMVGFVMYGYEADFGWFVTRVMVDVRYQGRGFGRAAMQRIIEHVKAEGGTAVGISYEADNEPARQLYASLGFVETGEAPYGEPLAVLKLDDNRESK